MEDYGVECDHRPRGARKLADAAGAVPLFHGSRVGPSSPRIHRDLLRRGNGHVLRRTRSLGRVCQADQYFHTAGEVQVPVKELGQVVVAGPVDVRPGLAVATIMTKPRGSRKGTRTTPFSRSWFSICRAADELYGPSDVTRVLAIGTRPTRLPIARPRHSPNS
jgi:hypothetical protein